MNARQLKKAWSILDHGKNDGTGRYWPTVYRLDRRSALRAIRRFWSRNDRMRWRNAGIVG